MKILNVNMSIDPVGGGGTAERTIQLSKLFAENNNECSILTTDIGITADFIKKHKKINIVALTCLNKRFYIPLISIKTIKKEVKDADIIHLMGHWTIINAIIYFYIKKYNKPYTVCPAGALPIYGRSKIIKWIYNLLIGKKIIRNSNKCIAITKKEHFDFHQYRILENQIVTIPNGINIEDYKEVDNSFFREKLGIQKKVILFVGRLNYIKGPDLLLNAFINLKHKLIDYDLLFIGPNEGMLEELKEIADKSDVTDKVHFAGYIGGAEKSMAYHAADLVVIPSRQEAMSIVVLEAGITGTPVVITDQCGFDEVVKNGGIVVSATIKGIENGISDILNNSGSLIEKGNILKKFCTENYSWESVIKEYYEIQKELSMTFYKDIFNKNKK